MNYQEEKLFSAIKNGNLLNVKEFFCQKEILDAIKFCHLNFKYILADALEYACSYSQKEIIQYLVEEQKIDVKNNENNALIIAASQGDISILECLINYGADIQAREGLVIENAIIKNDLEMIKYLIEQGFDIHMSNDLALRISVDYNRLEIIQYLIEKGAYININYCCPLRSAIGSNYLEATKLLIENNADTSFLNIYAFDGMRTAIINNARIKGLKTLKYLVNEYDIDLNIQVNSKDKKESLLSVAIQSDDYDIVEFLIEKNVDLSINYYEDVKKIAKKNKVKIIHQILIHTNKQKDFQLMLEAIKENGTADILELIEKFNSSKELTQHLNDNLTTKPNIIKTSRGKL